LLSNFFNTLSCARSGDFPGKCNAFAMEGGNEISNRAILSRPAFAGNVKNTFLSRMSANH
jgi:hypothetical protein